MDSSYLTFAPDNLPNYTGTGDPIDVFAYSAFALDIHIVFSNHFQYGYFIDSTTHVGHEHAAIVTILRNLFVFFPFEVLRFSGQLGVKHRANALPHIGGTSTLVPSAHQSKNKKQF
jgi:hypothetical protein